MQIKSSLCVLSNSSSIRGSQVHLDFPVNLVSAVGRASAVTQDSLVNLVTQDFLVCLATPVFLALAVIQALAVFPALVDTPASQALLIILE